MCSFHVFGVSLSNASGSCLAPVSAGLPPAAPSPGRAPWALLLPDCPHRFVSRRRRTPRRASVRALTAARRAGGPWTS